MTDRPKNSAINIPINFVDRAQPSSETVDPFDDAIEIDADTGDFDEYSASEAEAIDAVEVEAGSEGDAAAVTDADDEAAPDESTAPSANASEPAPAVDRSADAEGQAAEPETAAESAVEEAERGAESGPLPGSASAGPLPGASGSGPLGGSRDRGKEAPSSARAAEPAAEENRLSVEAFTQLGQELRQKSELADRLLAEKNSLYDQMLRKQAEFENFRKRTEREMTETYSRARADILLDLIPALDNFDLALQHADNANPAVLQEGVALIHKQLADILGKHGLQAVEAMGKPFDPELHEAVAAEADESVDDHTVLQELQRGYKIGDRLLRPARVKVSVHS